MSVISPILTGVVALLVLVGSPSFGYILIRFAFPFTAAWSGWKRALCAGVVGIGWSVMLLFVLLPALNEQTISPQQIGEWAWWVGLGIMTLAAITRGAVFVSLRGLAHPAMIGNSSTANTSTNPSESFSRANENPFADEDQPSRSPIYKPSQIRTNVTKQSPKSEMDEPILENDVLDLLKQESPTRNTPTNTRSAQPAPTMVDFGTSESFEDTLEQLKKDLKDFNESVSTSPKKKGEKNNE